MKGRSSATLIMAIIAMIAMFGGIAVYWRDAEGTRPSDKSRAAEGERFPGSARSRQREAPDLSAEALCGRIAKSFRIVGSSDAVYQSIQADLRHLSGDEILALLGGLDATACGNVGNILQVLLLDLLAKQEPALTADHMLANSGAGDIHWDAFSESFFDGWVRDDPEAAIAWLDARHRDLPNDGSLIVIARGETAILARLIEKDPHAALERLKSFPSTLASPVVNAAFRRNSHLMAPDQAIDFLRESLDRENHEALVGYVCGQRLYSKGHDGMRDFFNHHEATQAEREAIIREAIAMEVMMGFGGDADDFLRRSREFAEQEGPGAVDHITAVILGETSDRDRNDRAAVDLLMELDVNEAALRKFLEIRGSSLDETQRLRIQERLTRP